MTYDEMEKRDNERKEYKIRGQMQAEPFRKVVDQLGLVLDRFARRLEALYDTDNETEYPDSDGYTASDQVEHDLACEDTLDSIATNTASIAVALNQISENMPAPGMSDDVDYGCARDRLMVIKLLLEYGTDEEKEWAMCQLRKIKDSTLFTDWSKIRIIAAGSSDDEGEKYDE